MRYLIFIFVLFFADYSFADPVPNTGQIKGYAICQYGATNNPCQSDIVVNGPTSIDPSTGNTVYAWSSGFSNTYTLGDVTYQFDSVIDNNFAWYIGCPPGLQPTGNLQCSCPDGQQQDPFTSQCVTPPSCDPGYSVSWTSNGPICAPDSSSGCPAGQSMLFGQCRDAVDSPGDCAAGETAVQGNDGQGYQCFPAQDCPSDYPNASTYNNATQSNTVCTAGDSQSSSEDNNANSSSASQGTSSGDGSSSGSGGGGTGNGDNGGVSGSSSSVSSGDSSSGTGTGGGSASSAAGGSASSAGNGSASSGSGNAASSVGAGDCDPTSKNYLSCLTQGSHGVNKPDKGSFDGSLSQQALQDAEGEYQQVIDGVRADISQQFGSANFSGQGTLQDFCYTIFSQQVCFGLARFSGDLSYIGQAIFLIGCVLSFFIIARR